MYLLNQQVQDRKQDILLLADKYAAKNIRIFASVARGDFDSNSDIDFLVDFEPDLGLFEWSGFSLDLLNLLDHDVDVATKKTVKKRFRDKVLDEAVPL